MSKYPEGFDFLENSTNLQDGKVIKSEMSAMKKRLGIVIRQFNTANEFSAKDFATDVDCIKAFERLMESVYGLIDDWDCGTDGETAAGRIKLRLEIADGKYR